MEDGEVDTTMQPQTQLLPNNGGCVDVDSLPSLEVEGEVVGDESASGSIRDSVEEIQPNEVLREGIADECREKFQQSFLRYNKPLNVLLIGQAGVGKTSFINSVICANNKKRGHWLTIGAGDRVNVTSILRRINICEPDEESQRFLQVEEEDDPTGRIQDLQRKAPRFFDVSGLPDENNDVMRMLLRLLLYGHIPVGANLLNIHADGVQDGAAVLQDMLPKCHDDLIIDRVVVVCAANVNIPSDLTKAVMEAFQPVSYRHQLDSVISKRAVPVFGLLTKQDLIERAENGIEEDYRRRKKTLTDKLCLRGYEIKLGECQNYRYSKDDEQESVNDPEIDISVLRFMKVVCDTTHHIDNPDFRLTTNGSPFWKLLPEMTTVALIVSLLILLVLIGVFVDHQVAGFIGVLGTIGWVSLTYLQSS